MQISIAPLTTLTWTAGRRFTMVLMICILIISLAERRVRETVYGLRSETVYGLRSVAMYGLRSETVYGLRSETDCTD